MIGLEEKEEINIKEAIELFKEHMEGEFKYIKNKYKEGGRTKWK